MLEMIRDKWRDYKIVISLGALGMLIGTAFLVFHQPTKAEQLPDVLTLASSLEQADSSEKEKDGESQTPRLTSQTETIMVDVKGAVASPGLYELKAGSRLAEAVKQAGGLLETADPKSINLAQKLSDEAVVYVATKEEGLSAIPNTATSSVQASSQATTGLVNINTADASQLQTISGIGAKRAQDIIAYREANGPFKTVDDLNNVSGIGDKTLENLKPYVTVD